MAGRTPDWSELASENERFLTALGASGERLVPASLWQASAEQVAGPALAAAAPVASAALAAAAPVPGPLRRARWRIRAAPGAAVGTAAVLAVTAAGLAVVIAPAILCTIPAAT